MKSGVALYIYIYIDIKRAFDRFWYAGPDQNVRNLNDKMYLQLPCKLKLFYTS
jgi:hypothetical protein